LISVRARRVSEGLRIPSLTHRAPKDVMNLERNPTLAMTYPPFVRAWSALTCGVAFLTVLVGTLVTTFHVGMADPLWPTAPWHLLLIEKVPNFGFYVEHTHRIVAYTIGACILVQTTMLWWSSPRLWRRLAAIGLIIAIGGAFSAAKRMVAVAPVRSIDALLNPGFLALAVFGLAFLILAGSEIGAQVPGRWQRFLGTVAFLCVIVQGLLGGLRVYLNELRGPELQVAHGIFAQVVFALPVLLLIMTGPHWNCGLEMPAEPPLRKLTAATVVLLAVQILFGGLLRHLSLPAAQRLHPMLAFAVAALVAVILVRMFALGEGWASMRRAAALLGVLVAVQAVLGVEAWLRHADVALRFQPVGVADAAVRSLHVLAGFGVFAAAAVLAARAWKAKLI